MEAPKGKNFSQMTKEELQQCGKIGQLKGTETKRRKKTMKSVLEVLLKMPVGKGKVIEVNEAIVDSPELLNDDGYADKWLIKIESSAEQVEFADLLDYSDYREEIE